MNTITQIQPTICKTRVTLFPLQYEHSASRASVFQANLRRALGGRGTTNGRQTTVDEPLRTITSFSHCTQEGLKNSR